MQCHALPTKVCDAVDKIMRDFLWGSTEEKKKMYMVNWHVVSLPKESIQILTSIELFFPYY